MNNYFNAPNISGGQPVFMLLVHCCMTYIPTTPVILFPLHPASLMHKNPQRHKIIHGIRPVGRKDRSIDLNPFV